MYMFQPDSQFFFLKVKEGMSKIENKQNEIKSLSCQLKKKMVQKSSVIFFGMYCVSKLISLFLVKEKEKEEDDKKNALAFYHNEGRYIFGIKFSLFMGKFLLQKSQQTQQIESILNKKPFSIKEKNKFFPAFLRQLFMRIQQMFNKQISFIKSKKSSLTSSKKFYIWNLKKIPSIMESNEQKPNFLLVTHWKLKQNRQIMMKMLSPFHRQEAKQDFINFSQHLVNQELKEFSQNYSPQRSRKDCFLWWSRETFFYKVVNRGLKFLANDEKCVGYLRLPFSDLYYSIKEVYQSQMQTLFSSSEKIICYRGCSFTDYELDILSKSVNQFIQLQGFVSTSLSESIALSYQKDTIIEIKVEKGNLQNSFNHGFAELSQYSTFPQKQILFNPLNLFKVISVKKKQVKNFNLTEIQINRIQLEFGVSEDLINKVQERVSNSNQGKSENTTIQEITIKMLMKLQKTNRMSFPQSKWVKIPEEQQHLHYSVKNIFVQKFLIEILPFFVKRPERKALRQNNLSYTQEIIKLSSLETVSQKMQKKNRQTINFTFLTGIDKKKVNKRRFSMLMMLREIDRKKAFEDFVQFSKMTSEEVRSQLKLIQIGKMIEASSQMYDASMKKFIKKGNRRYNCLKQYTKNSFFCKVTNKSLRILTNPTDLFYLRLPFSDLFFSIRKIYEKQSNFPKGTKKSFYRGCSYSEYELKLLKENVNNYLQFQGFLSTSTSLSTSLGFYSNVLIEIVVEQENKGGWYDFGFANISEYSDYLEQEEVIFNPMNIFKILEVGQNKESELNEMVVKLQYGGFNKVERKFKNGEIITEQEKKMISFFKYQEHFFQNYHPNARILQQLGQFKLSQQYLQKELFQIKIQQKCYPNKEQVLINKAQTLFMYGLNYYKQNNILKAVQLFKEVEKILDNQQIFTNFASIIQNIIQILETGEIEVLQKYLKEINQKIKKKQIRNSKIKQQTAQALKLIAHTQEKIKEEGKLKQDWYEEDSPFFIQNLIMLATIQAKQKNWKEVLQKTDKAIKVVKRGSSEHRQILLLKMEAFYEECKQEEFMKVFDLCHQYKVKQIKQRKQLLQMLAIAELCFKAKHYHEFQIALKDIFSTSISYKLDIEDLRSFIFLKIELKKISLLKAEELCGCIKRKIEECDTTQQLKKYYIEIQARNLKALMKKRQFEKINTEGQLLKHREEIVFKILDQIDQEIKGYQLQKIIFEYYECSISEQLQNYTENLKKQSQLDDFLEKKEQNEFWKKFLTKIRPNQVLQFLLEKQKNQQFCYYAYYYAYFNFINEKELQKICIPSGFDKEISEIYKILEDRSEQKREDKTSSGEEGQRSSFGSVFSSSN